MSTPDQVEVYKNKLMDILLLEEKEAKSLTCEFQDDWYGGVEYIFSRLKEFINSDTIAPRSWQSYDEKRLAYLQLRKEVSNG